MKNKEHIEGSGPGAAPLIRRTVDSEGNKIVILGEWFYDQLISTLDHNPVADLTAKIEGLRVYDDQHQSIKSMEHKKINNAVVDRVLALIKKAK